MIKPDQIIKARAYIGKIRNPAKRMYASCWLAWQRGIALEPSREGISVMAAQAVRMRLREIMPSLDSPSGEDA